MAEKSQCQTDIFSVTSPGNNAPPQICGTNTGEHSKYTIFFSYLKKIYFIGVFKKIFLVYMDSSEMCNELAFNIGTTTTVTRSWTIKVSNCLLKLFI